MWQLRCYKGKLTALKKTCRLLAFSPFPLIFLLPLRPPLEPLQGLAQPPCSSNAAVFQGFIIRPLLFLFCALCLGELIGSQPPLPQTRDRLPNWAPNLVLSWPPKPLVSDWTHSPGTSKSRPKQIHHLTAPECGLPSLVPRPMATHTVFLVARAKPLLIPPPPPVDQESSLGFTS